jgi:hypothetical protein
MELKKLDKFSRLIYSLFSSKYPEWITYAKNMPGNEEALEIDVPSPQDAQRKLNIYTDNEQITVAFDHAHSHFGGTDVQCTEAFTDANERVNGIINEEWLVASEIKDGKCISSSIFAASMLDEIIRNNPRINRIVGWNYTYLTEDNSELE